VPSDDDDDDDDDNDDDDKCNLNDSISIKTIENKENEITTI